MNAHAAARRLAERGIPVFPCLATKAPACPRGFHAATADPEAVGRLWREYPGPLIGVPTGKVSGFDVLDIDAGKGGLAWLDANRERLPPTRTHATRSGGFHLLFLADPAVRCTASRIAPGVDTRAAGGYVIYWPATGLGVVKAPLAAWPAWLLRKLQPPAPAAAGPKVPLVAAGRYASAALRNAATRLETAGEGCRNETLNREAFALSRLIKAGAISATGVADTLVYIAKRNGLPEIEARRTIGSALRAGGVTWTA